MEIDRKTIRSLILGAMGCIILYWLLHETERVTAFLGMTINLVRPFLVGACLAFILNVPMRAIERQLKKLPRLKGTRPLAILLSLVAIVLVLVFVICMLVPQIQATVSVIGQQLPPFLERTMNWGREFLQENPELKQWLKDNTGLDEWVHQGVDWPTLAQQAIDLAGDSIGMIFGSAVSAVGSAISGVWSIFVSLVFGTYCLGNKEKLARQGRRLLYATVPEKAADEIIRVLRLTNSTFSNFISGQCLEVIILGSLFAVTMTIFRMPYVPLVSVLVAVTAFIPIVGAWVGCILGAFFILVDSPMQAVWFVIMFLVLQQIENNLIYPRVVGTSIGLPSMWVLAAVSIGGSLMGVGGMVVMIPLVSVVYALLREFAAKRVAQRGIDPEKLQPQPPELKSKFKEKREQSRRKREAKKAAQLAEIMKHSFHIPDHKDDTK